MLFVVPPLCGPIMSIFRRCRRLTKKLQPLHFLLWTELSARQVYVLLHRGQWCILLMILFTPAFFIIVMLFFSFLSMFKVKHLPLTDITQHSNQSLFWDRRDAGGVLIFIIFYMEKPLFVGQAICRQYSMINFPLPVFLVLNIKKNWSPFTLKYVWSLICEHWGELILFNIGMCGGEFHLQRHLH
jgi:hypothetical protein